MPTLRAWISFPAGSSRLRLIAIMQPRDIFSSNHPLPQNTHMLPIAKRVSACRILRYCRSWSRPGPSYILQADDDKIEHAIPYQSYGESFESSAGESRVSAIRTERLLPGYWQVSRHLSLPCGRPHGAMTSKETKTPSLHRYRVFSLLIVLMPASTPVS